MSGDREEAYAVVGLVVAAVVLALSSVFYVVAKVLAAQEAEYGDSFLDEP